MSDWEDPYYRLPRKNPNLQRVWKARAHAKVNIHLGVGPAREDGYHELSTVFQSVDIYDDITLTIRDEVIERGYSPVVGPLKITGPTAAGVPTDESNLVWKAIDRLAVHVPLTYPRLDVEIHKRIPAAGGMAGGSADAAAALMLAQKLYATYFELEIASDDILQEIAADLGSDVPFTMMGGTALGKSCGEVLSPMLTRGTYHWCFIASHRGLSTPEVFRKLDAMREESTSEAALTPSLDVTDVAQALVSGDVHRLAKVLKTTCNLLRYPCAPTCVKPSKSAKTLAPWPALSPALVRRLPSYARTPRKRKKYAPKSPWNFPRPAATWPARPRQAFVFSKAQAAKIGD